MHAEDICEIRFLLDNESNALASQLLLGNDVDDSYGALATMGMLAAILRRNILLHVSKYIV